METERPELVDLDHALGQIGRVIAVRLRPGRDLVGSLLNLCKTHKIRAGTIPAVLGTLKGLTYRSVAADRNAKSGIGYSSPQRLEGPVEVVGGQGVISEFEDGNLFIHLHLTVADQNMRIYGGHVEEGDATVLSTIDTFILEASGFKLLRSRDPNLDLMVMRPTSGHE